MPHAKEIRLFGVGRHAVSGEKVSKKIDYF
jgi:hypothetical protein